MISIMTQFLSEESYRLSIKQLIVSAEKKSRAKFECLKSYGCSYMSYYARQYMPTK